jgi:hypothetical protein
MRLGIVNTKTLHPLNVCSEISVRTVSWMSIVRLTTGMKWIATVGHLVSSLCSPIDLRSQNGRYRMW